MATIVRNFVTENFKKLPNLVTLINYHVPIGQLALVNCQLAKMTLAFLICSRVQIQITTAVPQVLLSKNEFSSTEQNIGAQKNG